MSTKSRQSQDIEIHRVVRLSKRVPSSSPFPFPPTAVHCGAENHSKKPPAGIGTPPRREDDNQRNTLIVRLTAQRGRLDGGKEQIKRLNGNLSCRALGPVYPPPPRWAFKGLIYRFISKRWIVASASERPRPAPNGAKRDKCFSKRSPRISA